MRKSRVPLLAALFLLAPAGFASAAPAAPPSIAELAHRGAKIRVPTYAPAEIAAAVGSWRTLRTELAAVDEAKLDPDDRIDLRLLREHAEIQLFELDELKLYQLVPFRYFALGETDDLLLRPCSAGGNAIRGAIAELGRLPEVLENGKKNLTRPARVWTENAIYTAWYAKKLLGEELENACLGQKDLRGELLAAAKPALAAVIDFEQFLEKELLPRSDRSPAWKPEEIEKYQLVQEQLPPELGGALPMLALAEAEEKRLMAEMEAVAKRIHPSGNLQLVWQQMKEEAPPWPEVVRMAEWYVEHAAEWLEGDGAHLLGIPDRFDYGVAITSPMGRRILSFGGASYGPTLAGRISGYYVLTPLEERLTPEEKASRLRSYNPYWTHVISYHEWVGHNVQRAWAQKAPDRPARHLAHSAYLSQAWSFYLEKLFEDHGYYATLPHVEMLKTAMARRQMRMWRVQRIITKLRMAQGTMTFEEAVDAYVEKIGMERGNAFIEVQRDSQTPASPGREIVGELVIQRMRETYLRRFGSHAKLRNFHEDLLSQGELPLPTIERILLGD
jgi:hypothetical protein